MFFIIYRMPSWDFVLSCFGGCETGPEPDAVIADFQGVVIAGHFWLEIYTPPGPTLRENQQPWIAKRQCSTCSIEINGSVSVALQRHDWLGDVERHFSQKKDGTLNQWRPH